MPYTPNNIYVFQSAQAGALAGMGAGPLSDGLALGTMVTYTGVAKVAFAFAQAFDALWDLDPTTQLDVQEIQACSEETFALRTPPVNTETVLASNWGEVAAAVMALVQEGTAYAISQGVVPTAINSGTIPTVPTVWTNVAAGGTGTVTNGIAAAFACDTTGALDIIDFAPAPADGQVVIVKALGASNTNGIRGVPGTALQAFEDPATPGTLLAVNTPFTFFGVGGCLTYKYELTGKRWLIQSNA